MRDKTNVEDIIGLIKTDEVTNSVEEVRKLRGRISESEFEFDGKCWKRSIPVVNDSTGDESIDWIVVPITAVPVSCLLVELEDMVLELSDKEVELAKVKEEFTVKEFDIVFKSDINFKELYGSTSEKVRKQHAKDVLSDLYDKKVSLELSVEFLRMYIGLLKEVIRSK